MAVICSHVPLSPAFLRCTRLKKEQPGVVAPSHGRICAPRISVRARSSLAEAQEVLQFSATLNTNLALKQIPEATFDDYISDPERVFKAFFPDADRCEQLSEVGSKAQTLD